jgi:dipeptidyl aminopeptidase/acylaminoacyl peptidase
MLKKSLFLVFIILSNIGFSQSKIQVTDLVKIRQAVNLLVAPNKKSAVYCVKTTEPNAENKLEYDYRSHLWLTDFKDCKQITFGQENESAFSWSPDSKQIAFLRNVKGKTQIHLMNLDGGEAMQLTDFKYAISSVSFSPDGKNMIFSASLKLSEIYADSLINPNKIIPTWSIEKPGFDNNNFLKLSKATANPDGNLEEIRAYLTKNEFDKKAKVINRLDFQGESTTEPELSFTQTFIVKTDNGKSIETIGNPFITIQNIVWAGSGTGFYFVRKLNLTKHPDREQDTGIFYFDLKTKLEKLIIGKPGFQYNGISLSKNEKYLSLKISPSIGVNFGELAIFDLTNNQERKIDFDRSAGTVKWAENSQKFYFSAQSNGAQPMFSYDISKNKISQLSDNESGILEFDLTENGFVHAKTSIDNPNEVYISDIELKTNKAISNINDWVKQKQISKPIKGSFKNEKGLEIEYWIVKPTDFDKTKKYPLLLNMHGGPTAMWGPGEFSMWHEFQYMAAQGYGIVYANPRGSGGYGLKFQQANFKDWGTGPASDVLKACSIAAAESWVDTSKMVITGGSYAGYLTAWIVGHDNRFKAAFAQRGVYDLTTFMGEGNAWRLTPNYFGLPWVAKDFETLKYESPYSYVDKIKTPLLIKHGENDLRTGIIQSEMLYKSMKYLGKDVEYVRMPGGTHELSRSGNVRQRIDRMLRIYEFFERYVGKK